MRLLVLLLTVSALAAQAQSNAPAANAAAPTAAAEDGPNLRSVGTMSEIMLDMIFPTSNELFYVGRNEDKSQKDWNDLRNNMLMLAETANLLMADNRAKDKDQWMKDAKLLREVATKAFKLAKAKDLEGLKALNDEAYESCQSCHVHYRPGYRRRL